ncbi:MAG: HAD family hydrolase [Lentisphaerae bacterium]|nr:HAD family hydrolase [Lentisphaerota bacterium]
MIKHVAFDFDGTLADSVDFCLYVFDAVFKKYMGDQAPEREAIYQCFGMNEPGVIRNFVGSNLPEAEEEFYRLHRQWHLQMCPDLFPGCRKLLDYLRERNIPVSIVTGRSETTCQISVEVLQLQGIFTDFQYGAAQRNDKSAQLQLLMDKYDLSADEILYVGDAVSDAEACHAAGVKCLSAAWAKSARIAELEKINPGLVFRTVEAMIDYLQTH